MTSLTDIYKFISDLCGVKISQLKPDTDLFADLGIDGDDFFELEAEFEKKFSVDMSSYLWYFHHGEEASPSIARLLFKSSYPKVKRICVTPELLLESANAHHWILNYPEHKLTSQRLGFQFKQIFFSAICIIAFVFLGWKWL